MLEEELQCVVGRLLQCVLRWSALSTARERTSIYFDVDGGGSKAGMNHHLALSPSLQNLDVVFYHVLANLYDWFTEAVEFRWRAQLIFR
jgi:hypothetical protein